MKRTLSIFIFFFCQLPTSYCQLNNYWQQQVNYKIDITLNDVEHTLDGFVRMEYFNNSPDTLYFIWIHLWPNAYKNDKTAFTDQVLENGSTAFYFSNDDKRGYINRLDFKVNGEIAKTEDHPQHQDIIKLILPVPIAPKSITKIETPFHVKLPHAFSRGGHIDQAYQITQWYPKPAVYDRKGWHPMPYLDQGEFYCEFGNYEVQITLPGNYVVAATGDLQNESEKYWLKNKKPAAAEPKPKKQSITKKVTAEKVSTASVTIKTLQYKQNNVHDFAWFAGKNYIIKKDTLQLNSGKVIDVYAYYYPNHEKDWKNSIAMIKRAILTKSKWLGEYPYQLVSVVDGGNGGGMEYPTITILESGGTEKMLDQVINHEVGHNWFEAILATNERTHPWMDEGMNTYYDDRYLQQQYGNTQPDLIQTKSAFIKNRMPDDIQHTLLQTITGVKKDQPIETSSEKFNILNYNMIAYTKTGEWMKLLEDELGRSMFDSCMQEYYRRWQFKHPYPEDFKKVIEDISGKNTDGLFTLLNKKGDLKISTTKKDIRFTSFFSFKGTTKHNYIFAAPAIGYNFYDKLMLGAVLHNYTLPLTKFKFVIVPLYAFKSKQVNSIGRAGYHWIPNKYFQKIETSINWSSFSSKQSFDTTGIKVFERFYKISPSLKFYFNQPVRSSKVSWLDVRTFLIGEKHFTDFKYLTGSDSVAVYPTGFIKTNRYINQLTFSMADYRVLYPYNYQVQFQQGEGFYRLHVTGQYFFNYAQGGGLQARVFAAKFGYTGNKKIGTYAYQPKLLGGTGEDDYTYSNYFAGRSASSSNPELPVANNGIAGQQIMIQNGGGLKLRMDKYSYLYGQSENWVAAINLNSSLPKALFPFKLPLRLFFDIGSYAEAWQKNAVTNRLLYTGGLQLSLFKDVLNIYAPLVYSKVFKTTLKTDPDQNKFLKRITFSIDIQNINLKKSVPQIPF